MHGNTFTSATGRKTGDFDAVLGEIAGFFAAHWDEGTWPGGVHIELTGEDVTECLGGGDALDHADLDDRYETMSTPGSTAASRSTWRSRWLSCSTAARPHELAAVGVVAMASLGAASSDVGGVRW